MLSRAQPVTGIAPAIPVVLFAGVSKLPYGGAAGALLTFTWICWGEPGEPAAVTVIVPPGPALAVTWMLPLPLPEVGKTVIFDALEDAVQFPGVPLRKFTATVCVLVISVEA
jgi:hypothetical protein